MLPLLYVTVVLAVPIAEGWTNLNPVSVAFSVVFSALLTVMLKKSVGMLLFNVNVPFEEIIPLGVPLPLIDTNGNDAAMVQIFADVLVLLKETVMLAPGVVLSASERPVALVELIVTLIPVSAIVPVCVAAFAVPAAIPNSSNMITILKTFHKLFSFRLIISISSFDLNNAMIINFISHTHEIYMPIMIVIIIYITLFTLTKILRH